jgi:hypothetical protein
MRFLILAVLFTAPSAALACAMPRSMERELARAMEEIDAAAAAPAQVQVERAPAATVAPAQPAAPQAPARAVPARPTTAPTSMIPEVSS